MPRVPAFLLPAGHARDVTLSLEDAELHSKHDLPSGIALRNHSGEENIMECPGPSVSGPQSSMFADVKPDIFGSIQQMHAPEA